MQLTKTQIIAQIRNLPKLAETKTLEEAIAYSNKHPETQPHFIFMSKGVKNEVNGEVTKELQYIIVSD